MQSETGVDIIDTYALGVRKWGTDPDGPDAVLVGTYNFEGDVTRRLLGPSRGSGGAGRAPDSPIATVLAAEIGKDGAGQTAVLDRLLDLLLIATLRAWFDRPGGDAPAWYRAQSDEVVGPALASSTTTRPAGGRWRCWRPRSACRGPCWPAGSPSWWVTRP